MDDEDYGLCLLCGNKVPVDLLPDHLSEHGVATAQEIRDAPVEEIDDPDDEAAP